jgi:predicted phosphodiesterase
MRIVAVADTHTFEKDLGELPEGDVFVHAGDLLRGGTLDELAPVADWIRRLPHRHKIVVAGNHDGCFQRERAAACAVLGDVVYLEDSEIVIDGVRFWGSPWQPAYNDWFFNLPRGAALAEKWARIPEGIDVLVTHGPPLGFGDQGPVEGRAGCQDLLARVRVVRPALYLFGHIHQDGGLWREGGACFCNVTTWECERGATVIDFDPARRSVTAVDVPPARSRG